MTRLYKKSDDEIREMIKNVYKLMRKISEEGGVPEEMTLDLWHDLREETVRRQIDFDLN